MTTLTVGVSSHRAVIDSWVSVSTQYIIGNRWGMLRPAGAQCNDELPAC